MTAISRRNKQRHSKPILDKFWICWQALFLGIIVHKICISWYPITHDKREALKREEFLCTTPPEKFNFRGLYILKSTSLCILGEKNFRSIKNFSEIFILQYDKKYSHRYIYLLIKHFLRFFRYSQNFRNHLMNLWCFSTLC